ncbi:MAG: hypothetical protein LBL09_01715 [Oscillospiraceae bacterium]|jgi:putative aldouronate transport system substrate-binding protein|nr:hypothetical protein [Oscillospiraceae bacterium]
MKKVLSLILVSVLLLALMVGCTGDSKTTAAPTPSSAAGGEATATPSPETDQPEFPLTAEPRKFSFYHRVDAGLNIESNADNLYWKEMAKLTNISFDWIHPPLTNLSETFNLMIASQNYPNVIHGFYGAYTPGIDDAIESDIIYALNDYTQYLPNLHRWLESDNRYMLNSITDKGNFFGIPYLKNVEQGPWAGPIYRADLADKYNLDTPQTYADWENYLTICRDQEGMTEGPLGICMYVTSLFGSTNSGYGVGSLMGPWINKDGTVVNTVLTEDFREYITMMTDWFDKGLINRDFMSNVIYYGGGVPKFANGEISMGEATYDLSEYVISCPPEMKIAAIPLPVRNVGDVNHIRQTNPMTTPGDAAVFSTSLNQEDLTLLCRYFDYMFTEDGQLLANWGVEGITFEYGADGKPVWTDLITNNPDGMGVLQAQAVYLARNTIGVYEWTREITPEILEIMDIWSTADDAYVLPSGVSLTAEEATESSNIWGDCSTYISENVLLFVTGGKPLSEWDGFVNQLKSMDIDRCTELRQVALDRYLARVDLIK